MLAVIETGGKQYSVKEGDIICIENIQGKVGEQVSFNKVLMLCSKNREVNLGGPFIELAKVKAEILEKIKDKKIIVFKKKKRKNYRKKRGHRQLKTILKITKVEEN